MLNLSLSTDTPQSYKTDPLDAAVEYAWQKGIVVVAASGNRGNTADAVQYAPANDPYVISVGGIDETGNNGKGSRADWSSTGRTQDGIAKPEVMAPGAHIVSVLAPSSAFATLCPNCAIGGAYFKAGGTSMAAPVVSGAAALLLQARPTLTPDQVKALLMGTDKAVSGGDNGAGVIDVERAVYTQTYQVPPVNRYLQPNYLIDGRQPHGRRRSATWTRSSWSTATGALNAGWARSSWSCATCDGPGRRDRPAALLLEPQLLVERRRGRQRRGRAVRGGRRGGRGDRHARRADPRRRRRPDRRAGPGRAGRDRDAGGTPVSGAAGLPACNRASWGRKQRP